MGVRPNVKKFARKHSDRVDALLGHGVHNPIEYAGLTTLATDEMMDLLLKMGEEEAPYHGLVCENNRERWSVSH